MHSMEIVSETAAVSDISEILKDLASVQHVVPLSLIVVHFTASDNQSRSHALTVGRVL